jgi:GNAT superfamily N-acetyltransferase
MSIRTTHPICSKDDSYGYRNYSFPAYSHLLNFEHNSENIICRGLSIGEQPAGLALGYSDCEDSLTLLSLYIAPAFRQQGHAHWLLARWLDYVHNLGHSNVNVTYMTKQNSSAAVAALLTRADFDEPQLRNLIIQCSLQSAATIPWLQARRMPDNYQIVEWIDVNDEQKAELQLSDNEEHWIDPELVPSLYETNLEPLSSVALLVDGKIRAWCLNHLIEGKLRFSCSFAHPKLQRLGRITHLYHHAYRAMPSIGVEVGMWVVSVERPRMFHFAQRYMIPNASFHAETLGSRKNIGKRNYIS